MGVQFAAVALDQPLVGDLVATARRLELLALLERRLCRCRTDNRRLARTGGRPGTASRTRAREEAEAGRRRTPAMIF
jgi:hypothetical protein